jgi:hypothetical protein
MKKLDVMFDGGQFYISPVDGAMSEIESDFYSVSRKYISEGVMLYKSRRLVVGSGGRPIISNSVQGMYCPRVENPETKRLLLDHILEEFKNRGWKLG